MSDLDGRLAGASWTKCPDWLLDSGLSDTAQLVYLQIRRHANESKPGKFPVPKKATLAKRMGKTPRTIQRAIQELADYGAFAVKARYREDGSQTSNGYDFHQSPVSPAQDTDVSPPEPPTSPGPGHPRPPKEQEPLELEPSNKKARKPRADDPTAGIGTPKRIPPRKPRPRDLLWEAACELWPPPAEGNDAERGRMNRAVKRFRDAGVTPDEMAELKRRHEEKRHWEKDPSVMAVSGRIGELRAWVSPTEKLRKELNLNV